MEGYAICTSASFNLKSMQEHFQSLLKINKLRDVLHIQTESGDIFVFPYGALVSWGIAKDALNALTSEIKQFGSSSLDVAEEDDFSYGYGERAHFRNNIITLPDDAVLTKLAFSHGLAQSVKLSGFETTIRNIFQKNKHLPEYLAKDGKIPLSRKDIRRRMGVLFLERSSINLHVVDTPEFFWEHSQHEGIYQITAAELDLQPRVKALNQQLDVIHDLFEMLGNELNHQHSSRLEWAIILLIVLEVVLVAFHDILKWI
jgi:uncharacterized Rmd1/YagE family protein